MFPRSLLRCEEVLATQIRWEKAHTVPPLLPCPALRQMLGCIRAQAGRKADRRQEGHHVTECQEVPTARKEKGSEGAAAGTMAGREWWQKGKD